MKVSLPFLQTTTWCSRRHGRSDADDMPRGKGQMYADVLPSHFTLPSESQECSSSIPAILVNTLRLSTGASSVSATSSTTGMNSLPCMSTGSFFELNSEDQRTAAHLAHHFRSISICVHCIGRAKIISENYVLP
ncbi:hypothetical protein Btru_053007 [Bulinus truncatus]|nr:hypothetical protein Btru_053007 [Bulinus truncatus]